MALRISLVCLLLALLMGCAQRGAAPGLVLGQTERAQVIEQYGRPLQRLVEEANGERIEFTAYGRAAPDQTPWQPGITPARLMGFYFWQGRLAGYEFTSSAESDTTYFSLRKAAQVTQGIGRDELIALLGQPSGVYGYPLIPQRDAEGLVYLYAEARGEQVHRRLLVVVVDGQGRVLSRTLSVEGDSPLE
jgi:hypothetical protein